MKRLALTLAFAALILCPLKAKADVQTWVMVSSDVYSPVTVSSGVAVQVDYLNLGTTGYIMPGRNQIVLTIPKSSAAIDCNYGPFTVAYSTFVVSTQTASNYYGTQYAASSTQSLQITVPIPSYLSYWCQSEGVSTPTIHVDQQRPLGR